MSDAPIRWARIEYQPNLQAPVEPIPLGLNVLVTSKDSYAGAIIGKEPPEGFQPRNAGAIGTLAVAQLRGWVAATSCEAQEAQRKGADPFAALCARWRWNVYVTEPAIYETQAQRVDLWEIAVRVYKDATGKKFEDPRPPVLQRLRSRPR